MAQPGIHCSPGLGRSAAAGGLTPDCPTRPDVQPVSKRTGWGQKAVSAARGRQARRRAAAVAQVESMRAVREHVCSRLVVRRKGASGGPRAEERTAEDTGDGKVSMLMPKILGALKARSVPRPGCRISAIRRARAVGNLTPPGETLCPSTPGAPAPYYRIPPHCPPSQRLCCLALSPPNYTSASAIFGRQAPFWPSFTPEILSFVSKSLMFKGAPSLCASGPHYSRPHVLGLPCLRVLSAHGLLARLLLHAAACRQPQPRFHGLPPPQVLVSPTSLGLMGAHFLPLLGFPSSRCLCLCLTAPFLAAHTWTVEKQSWLQAIFEGRVEPYSEEV